MKTKLLIYFIGTILLISCYGCNTRYVTDENGLTKRAIIEDDGHWYYPDEKVDYYSFTTKYTLKHAPDSIKKEQSHLGWTVLPELEIHANKYQYIHEYKEKYKSIHTKHVENEILLKTLKSKTHELFYDIDSISKLSKKSGEVFTIRVLRTEDVPTKQYHWFMDRESLLSDYEISCSSNNKLKLINEMWWNGSWFKGLRYTWKDELSKMQGSFPEARNAKDYKWMEEYNSLLCDVVNNKNQIKAATWRKNDEKRKAKLKEEKRKAKSKEEKRRAKIQQEKERKAMKIKEDKRKLDINKAGKTCLDLGFKKGTKKYKNCVVELL